LQRIPFFKKLSSYIYPVRLKRIKGEVNPVLDLFIYRGRVQLATLSALYSDGNKYRPLVTAYKALEPELAGLESVLVLGTGLGSAVEIMHEKGYHPHFTLIDNDKEVLRLALEHLQDKGISSQLQPICADAAAFVRSDDKQYSLVIIDIFSSLHVPTFVTGETFLQNCKVRVKESGHIVMNYIAANDYEKKETFKTFGRVFPGSRVIDIGINNVFVATI
jgi:spermidine synthase